MLAAIRLRYGSWYIHDPINPERSLGEHHLMGVADKSISGEIGESYQGAEWLPLIWAPGSTSRVLGG
jgi:hypothetical protein